MATVYHDADADLGLVQARKVAVLGFGGQGEAHARNLRDSGCEVRVGLRAGSRSRDRAAAAGLPVAAPAEAAAWADLVWDLAKSYATALGGTRAGALVTTFQEETETGLFGAQAVLGGGVVALARAAYDALVAAGHQPEVAYLACVHELGIAAELLQRDGLAGMTRALSEVAEYGAGTRGARLAGEATVAELGRILDEAASGAFAREWLDEHAAGLPTLGRLREAAREHPAERTGRTVRAGMPWLDGAEED